MAKKLRVSSLAALSAYCSFSKLYDVSKMNLVMQKNLVQILKLDTIFTCKGSKTE